MTDIVFGRDLPPVGKRERMAYIGRASGCGHIRAIAVDNKPADVDAFVKLGVAGLTLERVPLDRATTEGIGECRHCKAPEQIGLGL